MSPKVEAQIQIKGAVVDLNGSTLSTGSVQMLSYKDSLILGYVMLSGEGHFSFTVPASAGDSIYIVFKDINYRSAYLALSTVTQEVRIQAWKRTTELKPVVLASRGSRIRKEGDTLSYDISSFSNKEDRSLADVLKKLPGIQVDENGKVSYQGVPINKFYVENSDLMQGRYGIITNGMPNVDVSKVEIYKNHQPVKILEGKVATFQPALNIKLKKGVVISGRGEVGAGAAPILWNTKLTPMLFSKPLQSVMDIKLNNVGEDLTQALQSLTISQGFEGEEYRPMLGHSLNTSSVSIPSHIQQNRYWRNNTQSLSANVLKKLKKDFELVFNASYLHDISKGSGTEQTSVIMGSAPSSLQYLRKSQYRMTTSVLNTKATITKNTQHFFLKNIVSYQINYNSEHTDLWLENALVPQKMKSPSYIFQNSFSILVPLDKTSKKILNFHSFVNLSNDHQRYNVDSSVGLSTIDSFDTRSSRLSQFYKSHGWMLDHYLSLPLSKGNFTVVPMMGIQQDQRYFGSYFFRNFLKERSNESLLYLNDVHFQQQMSYLKLMANYHSKYIKISVTSPLNYYHILAQDTSNDLRQHLHKVTFEPDAKFSWKASSFWVIDGYYNLKYQFSTGEDLMTAPILSSLNLNTNMSNIGVIQYQRLGPTVKYEDNLDLFFGYLSYVYNKTTSNRLKRAEIGNNGQSVNTTLLEKNISSSGDWHLNLEKLITSLKTKLRIAFNYSNGIFFQVTNAQLLRYKNYQKGILLALDNNILSVLSLNYKFHYNMTSQKAEKHVDASIIYDWKHEGVVYIFPVEGHQFKINIENANYKMNGIHRQQNTFVDLSYQYTLKKKKIDFELKCQNILNKTDYKEISIQNIFINSLQYQIRARQIIGSVKFFFR